MKKTPPKETSLWKMIKEYLIFYAPNFIRNFFVLEEIRKGVKSYRKQQTQGLTLAEYLEIIYDEVPPPLQQVYSLRQFQKEGEKALNNWSSPS